MAGPACIALVLLLAAPATAAAAPRADLRQSAPVVDGTRTVRAGAAMTVVDAVRNAGRRRARSTRTRLLISRDAVSSLDDVVLGERRTPRLRPRRASRRTLSLRLPALDPGTWFVIACADALRRVRERRERDNCRAALLPLRVPFPPPLPPPSPLPPAPAAPDPRAAEPRAADPAPPAPEPEPPPPSTELASIEDCDPATPEDHAPAAAFTAMFAATTRGWTGGDGTFSVRLPGGDTAWLFGDSFIAGLSGPGREPGPFGGRNLAVIQDEDCLTTLHRGMPEAPSDFELAGDGAWYWPNAAAVHDGEVRTFWTRLQRTGDGPFDFEVAGSVLATYDETLARTALDAGVTTLAGQWWGAAFADSGAHTYVFGIRDAPRAVFLARTPLHDLDGAWEYWDGADWSDDAQDSEPVLAEADEISTQLSVIADGAGWALISQKPLGRTVNAWRSGDLTSWAPRETLTTLPDAANALEYNALVHPQLTTADGQLLISYNVTPEDPGDLWADASLYRPRFVRAPLPPR